MTGLVAHARSAGVRNPRLELFDVPDTDLSMSSRRCVKINPFNTGINPVTFQVDPQEDFLDLNQSFFKVEFTAKKTNNTNLLQADIMGLANNLAHTLFKQINVRLNGTLISPQTDTYHLKAYLETILNHDRDDGDTILTPHGWYNCLGVPNDGDADELTAMWTIRWHGADTLRLTEADVSVRLNLCQVRVTPSVYIGLLSELRQGKKSGNLPHGER